MSCEELEEKIDRVQLGRNGGLYYVARGKKHYFNCDYESIPHLQNLLDRLEGTKAKVKTRNATKATRKTTKKKTALRPTRTTRGSQKDQKDQFRELAEALKCLAPRFLKNGLPIDAQGWRADSDKIGEGYQGVVYRACKTTTDNCNYALKVTTTNELSSRQIKSILDFSKKAGNLGVGPKVYASGICSNEEIGASKTKTSRTYYIFMDLVLAQDLNKLYRAVCIEKNKDFPVGLFGQALSAYLKLLEAGLEQSDLKAENVLVALDDLKHLKVIDYGLATPWRDKSAKAKYKSCHNAAHILTGSLTILGHDYSDVCWWQKDPQKKRRTQQFVRMMRAVDAWFHTNFPQVPEAKKRFRFSWEERKDHLKLLDLSVPGAKSFL